MNKRTIFILFIIVFVLIGQSNSFAQSRAVLKKITGKVEVKLPNRDWQGAWVGLVMSKGTIVATGFNSEAVIEMEGSVLTVKALSRLTLEELLRQGNEVNTRLYLRSGRVEADVDTTQGLKHNYRLRSPITTASVRGCKFDWDPKKLFVYEGTVVLYNLINRGGTAGAGEGVWTTTGLDMHTSEEEASKRAEVDIVTGDVPFLWFLNRWFRWGGFIINRRGTRGVGGRTTVSIVIFELEW